MGAFVKNLDTPRCCAECHHTLREAVACVYTKRVVPPEENDMRRRRHPECPLLPVPGDIRLISQDAVLTLFDRFIGYLDADMIVRLKTAVMLDAPVYVDTMGGRDAGGVPKPVDASPPVIRAHWVRHKIILGSNLEVFLCSRCLQPSFLRSKYCPNCGACNMQIGEGAT